MISKILLFGSNGMLGNYIKKYFNEKYKIICITRKEIDVLKTNYTELFLLFKKHHVNSSFLIFNAVGLIPQRKPTNKKDYYKINSIFPHLLADLSVYFNCKMIQPTTDCVFNGDKKNYDENSDHDSKTDYGISKSLGEPSNCCCIRVSIIGEEFLNKKSLLEWVKSNKNNEINGYINHYWNGITCLEYCKIIEKIINKNIYWNGVIHLYSTDISKYKLVKMINEIYSLNIKINKFKTEKSKNMLLKSKYNLSKILQIQNIYDQLIQLKNFKL